MKRLSIYIIAVCLSTSLWAQEVQIDSTTEQMDTARFASLIKAYEKVVMTEREELTLIKVDLLGPLLYAMSGIDTARHNAIRLAFERKFKPEWSWIVAFDAQVNRNEVAEYRYRGGVRYYFNMQKRILKGKSANNFSANYLSPRVSYRRKPGDDEGQLSVDLLFGIQRRLWEYGFVDFDIGIENPIVPFESNEFGIDFTTSITLGIGF